MCSHPLLFNFENKFLFKTLAPGQTEEIPISMKVSLIGNIQVKFLVRYEVTNRDGEPLPLWSRFRFQRVCIDLSAEQTFLAAYRIDSSSKQVGTYLVNMSIAARHLLSNTHEDFPQVRAIEIISSEKLWKLCKQDDSRFFSIMKNESPSSAKADEDSVLKFADDVQLIKQDESMKSLLDKEVDYAMENGLYHKGKNVKMASDKQHEVDFLLHWLMPVSGKKGFIVSFKQELKGKVMDSLEGVRSQSMIPGVGAAPPAQVVHVAFDFKK